MMQRPNSSSSVPNQHLNPSLIPSHYPFNAAGGNRVGVGASLPPSPFTGGDGENLPPPRKSHRRSNSDVTFGFSSMIPQSPSKSSISGGQEERARKSESDHLLRAYMNLDNIYGVEAGKTNGGSSCDSEGEGGDNVKVSSGLKRRAGGGDIAPATRHHRSVSMDSGFIHKLNDSSSSLKLPPTSPDFSVEFGNSEFTAAQLKKISADDKLAEIVVVDPKRVKRILANRVSAARSKERKTQYMVELEHKVQTLQSEATTLSAQLTHLQRDSMGLTNQNNELKFRLQAMEQQAQLRNALSEKLTEEIQRMKLVIGEPSRGRSGESNISKTSVNPEMFQQLRISQLQQQQMQYSNQI